MSEEAGVIMVEVCCIGWRGAGKYNLLYRSPLSDMQEATVAKPLAAV